MPGVSEKSTRLPSAGGSRSRRRVALLSASLVVLEMASTWIRARQPGGNLVVRCSEGHLFTTIWIPAASMKSLRLGWWRLQRCPVGRHWTVVTPVNKAKLTARQRRRATHTHDLPIP